MSKSLLRHQKSHLNIYLCISIRHGEIQSDHHGISAVQLEQVLANWHSDPATSSSHIHIYISELFGIGLIRCKLTRIRLGFVTGPTRILEIISTP
ncbi:uncharacterized protein VP01_874g1 [Puccinia sorghi]|uniref:Uncharacterized protein n=1 Tax=Puccinia sorghi TaxID=27349 RepID=A0A0L6U8N8_9BASI|nr:uncharacterized protein VP01_874g1 [Puccinia sorghi]